MLQIKNIHKEYRTGSLVQKALDGVSLNLRDSEFVAILGPSGSGKTTLLNIIGGLDRYDAGDLIINGISTKEYKDRDWDSYRNHTIGFVFQSYNLIPHQSVLANVELALTISGISKDERRRRALVALEQVGLGDQGHKKPNQMSGGQMQRVAIARALVNDPDILLADEPTGALDSDTSVQVMELLKDVAKDRLVVMVTHNPELAETYATRIVKLRDGVIHSDSDEFVVNENITSPVHKNMGKASMSFLTSLLLSFNNLRTKKARTTLTAFAGSIGIIGIALILSLSHGVNSYIQSIEEETLSEYPLQIESSGFDFSSMMAQEPADTSEAETTSAEDASKVHIMDSLNTMFSTVGSNDLVSLKEYLESDKTNVLDYTNAIEYSYGVSPQIYSADTSKIRRVQPNDAFSALGLGSTTSSNNIMSTMMSTDVFFEMPSNEDLYKTSYDVKKGRWPESSNECVLVLSEKGFMNDILLYTLGLRDNDDLDRMVKEFAQNEDVEVKEDTKAYTYDDILGVKFKLVNAADCYSYDSEYDVYVDKSEDKAYMKSLISDSEDIEIVGIVQPREDASATMLQMGIAYPASLTEKVINTAKNSNIVKKQIENPKIDVFTGKSFDEEESESAFDMNSLFTIDESKLQEAFVFDESKLKIDMSDLDLSNIKVDMSSMPAIDASSILANMEVNISQEQMSALSTSIGTAFQKYMTDNNLTDISKINEYWAGFIASEEAQQLMSSQVTAILMESGLVDQFSAALQKQMEDVMATYSASLISSVQSELTKEMTKAFGNMASSMGDAITIDSAKFAEAFKINMSETEMSELMMSLMTTEVSTYDGNLNKLGYADYNKPSSISIYPKDFETKQNVVDILDNYNAEMEKTDEDKVISYTDYVGTLMSSVTDIINVISYVLMAFVAISLIVSSIMIGVITYISVLERKKEIGILRAIGASKHNISQVFNAETFIIGLLAGVLGIGITLVLLIPGNMIIHSVAGTASVSAVLPVAGAVILIILSVILTLIGGLIPSKKAAQEDPVAALRSE